MTTMNNESTFCRLPYSQLPFLDLRLLGLSVATKKSSDHSILKLIMKIWRGRKEWAIVISQNK